MIKKIGISKNKGLLIMNFKIGIFQVVDTICIHFYINICLPRMTNKQCDTT